MFIQMSDLQQLSRKRNGRGRPARGMSGANTAIFAQMNATLLAQIKQALQGNLPIAGAPASWAGVTPDQMAIALAGSDAYHPWNQGTIASAVAYAEQKLQGQGIQSDQVLGILQQAAGLPVTAGYAAKAAPTAAATTSTQKAALLNFTQATKAAPAATPTLLSTIFQQTPAATATPAAPAAATCPYVPPAALNSGLTVNGFTQPTTPSNQMPDPNNPGNCIANPTVVASQVAAQIAALQAAVAAGTITVYAAPATGGCPAGMVTQTLADGSVVCIQNNTAAANTQISAAQLANPAVTVVAKGGTCPTGSTSVTLPDGRLLCTPAVVASTTAIATGASTLPSLPVGATGVVGQACTLSDGITQGVYGGPSFGCMTVAAYQSQFGTGAPLPVGITTPAAAGTVTACTIPAGQTGAGQAGVLTSAYGCMTVAAYQAAFGTSAPLPAGVTATPLVAGAACTAPDGTTGVYTTANGCMTVTNYLNMYGPAAPLPPGVVPPPGYAAAAQPLPSYAPPAGPTSGGSWGSSSSLPPGAIATCPTGQILDPTNSNNCIPDPSLAASLPPPIPPQPTTPTWVMPVVAVVATAAIGGAIWYFASKKKSETTEVHA